jgi:NTP pyrophosphatase (non-canonical NTP hydrolase)
MNDYEHMVKSLRKSAELIMKELTPLDCDLLHMAVGISGEAGEILDTVKKTAIYRKDIDIENIIEELGDLEFFMEGLRQVLGLNRDYILSQNMSKLKKRYARGYSNQQAQDRADKQ